MDFKSIIFVGIGRLWYLTTGGTLGFHPHSHSHGIGCREGIVMIYPPHFFRTNDAYFLNIVLYFSSMAAAVSFVWQ